MTALVPVRIEIERPDPAARLIIKNDRSTPLTLVSLREPARQARTTYAPTSVYVPGEVPLATVWEQSALGFDVAARGAVSETLAQGYVDELAVALLRLSVLVHVFYDDGLERIWKCNGGSVAPADDRDYVTLRDHDPVWSAAAPCYPIPVNP